MSVTSANHPNLAYSDLLSYTAPICNVVMVRARLYLYIVILLYSRYSSTYIGITLCSNNNNNVGKGFGL